MADIRTEMISHLEKLNGKEPVKETEQVETKPEEKEVVEDETQQEVEQDKELEDSEKEVEKVEEEGKEEDGKEKDKKKDDKPNRYQRLKKQRDDAVASVNKVTGEFHKAVKVANAWRAEALAFEKELKRVIEEAKTKGYSRDSQRELLFEYERDHLGRQVEQEFDKQLGEEKTKTEAQQIVTALKEKFSEEAHDLESKYGVAAKKILVQFHTERTSGNQVSMEDVAKELGELEAVRKKRRGESRQLEVNGNAPKPIRGGGGVKVDYPRTNEGMAAYLKSQGLG